MNERIQKLIEQATSTQGPTPYNPLTFEVFDKEKFAELIVGECAQVAKKEQAFNARYTDADKHPQVNIDQCILIEFGL